MQISERTDEQIQADIRQLQKILLVPNLPKDEHEMHSVLLEKLQLEMGRRMNATQNASQSANKPIQHTQNYSTNAKPEASPLEGGRGVNNPQQTTKSRTILAGGHAKTAQPITSKIELANNSDKFNPSITITWSDGYQITVDETAATGRFKSTFRDTLALKCVSEGRTDKMWRWDTPWRAAGFYDAITTMRGGIKPTLKDLGYTHPSDKQREIFAQITQAFSKEATNH